MATGIVRLTVVDVGQGQCTFVEIYNDDSPAKLVHTLLFDCGSDKTSDETDTNLDYIVTKVQLMDTPAFDCIFFSHSDKDHISLTKTLLKKFTTKPKIKEVWYGGARDKYKKRDFNILDYIEEKGYCETDNMHAPLSNYTAYDTGTGAYTSYLWRSTDRAVHVYAIVANVLSNDPDWDDNDEDVTGKKAEELNRVSIVCGLYYAGASYVIQGDATNVTMGAINNLFSAGTTVFNKNLMTTMPHHGSRATGFAVKSSQKVSDSAREVVTTYAGILKSQQLTISAFEKHRHPSLELINAFLPTLIKPFLRDERLKQKNTHRLSAYLDITLEQPKGWSLLKNTSYSFDTMSCTYGTKYSNLLTYFYYNLGTKKVEDAKGTVKKKNGIDIAINEHACWQFDTQTNGNPLLGGYPNLKLPLKIFTTGPEALAKQPGPEDIPLWEEEPVKASPVSTRIKQRPVFTNMPAQHITGLKTRLKQFH